MHALFEDFGLRCRHLCHVALERGILIMDSQDAGESHWKLNMRIKGDG